MLNEVVNNWTNETISELRNNYNRLGLRASGNWSKELEGKTKLTTEKINIKILGAKYSGVMTDGRNPNANQSSLRSFVGWAGSTFIKDWVERKGIQANPFAVAYKIGREGVKVPNRFNPGTLLTDVFTRKRTDKLLKSIGVYINSNITSELKNALK